MIVCNAWTFGYDKVDRPNGSLNPLGQSGWTNYFLDGSVESLVYPAGNREEHQYTAQGLPTFTQLKNSAGTLLSKQEYGFNDGLLGYIDDW